MRAGTRFALTLVSVVAAWPAAAQTSASYKLQENSLNSGGDPRGGTVLASASFHVKLDALGESVVQPGLSSASYHADASFVAAYPPPGEVLGIVFPDKSDLNWNPEKSVGSYAVYRDALSTLPGSFGTCLQTGLTATTVADAATPASGEGWFYLVTARNRLSEEGTKGSATSGPRGNPAPCP